MTSSFLENIITYQIDIKKNNFNKLKKQLFLLEFLEKFIANL